MKRSKLIIILIVACLIVVLIAVAVPQKESSNKEKLLGIDYSVDGNETKLKYDVENPVVAMYIENYGSIVIELYPKIAPNTVSNFISLVKSGFYDGNTFHRLVPGFVLQGGDPTGTGTGGPGYSIRGEFINNGFDNYLSHEKQVVSMAREGGNPDSAGSQFFICLADAKYLDGNYATFGRIIDGYSTIEKIEKNEEVLDVDSGKLKTNLKIKKAVIDLKEKVYPEVDIIK